MIWPATAHTGARGRASGLSGCKEWSKRTAVTAVRPKEESLGPKAEARAQAREAGYSGAAQKTSLRVLGCTRPLCSLSFRVLRRCTVLKNKPCACPEHPVGKFRNKPFDQILRELRRYGNN